MGSTRGHPVDDEEDMLDASEDEECQPPRAGCFGFVYSSHSAVAPSTRRSLLKRAWGFGIEMQLQSRGRDSGRSGIKSLYKKLANCKGGKDRRGARKPTFSYDAANYSLNFEENNPAADGQHLSFFSEATRSAQTPHRIKGSRRTN